LQRELSFHCITITSNDLQGLCNTEKLDPEELAIFIEFLKANSMKIDAGV
jgi:hypothetical protein